MNVGTMCNHWLAPLKHSFTSDELFLRFQSIRTEIPSEEFHQRIPHKRRRQTPEIPACYVTLGVSKDMEFYLILVN